MLSIALSTLYATRGPSIFSFADKSWEKQTGSHTNVYSGKEEEKVGVLSVGDGGDFSLYADVKMDGWLTILRPFSQYFSHMKTMGEWQWTTMCRNRSPFMVKKISTPELGIARSADQRFRSPRGKVGGALLSLCRCQISRTCLMFF